jgi:hypothetical protein
VPGCTRCPAPAPARPAEPYRLGAAAATRSAEPAEGDAVHTVAVVDGERWGAEGPHQ